MFLNYKKYLYSKCIQYVFSYKFEIQKSKEYIYIDTYIFLGIY